jgi:hypothetical protein
MRIETARKTPKPVSPPRISDDSQRINIIVDRKWLDLLDEWRKRQPGPPPTRSDAIRRIVEQALTDKKPRG